EFDKAKEYVLNNLSWIIPVAIAFFVLCIALWLVFTWLNSRGKFMFLHCVATNKAEVAVPWNKYAREGNSLFLFRIGLGVIGWLITLPLVVPMVLAIVRMVRHDRASVAGIVL